MRLIPAALQSAARATTQASVLLPSAAATLGSAAAFYALDSTVEFWTQPVGRMAALVAVLVARSWVGLTVSATALVVMRHDFRPRPTWWVGPTAAFEVAVVSIVLVLPIAAATLFLIIPGIWLALRWSQTMLLILDDRARWFESAEASADLVHGHTLELLGLWLILGAAIALVEWLLSPGPPGTAAAAVFGIARTGARVVVDAFALCLVAATYHELDRDPVA